MNIAIFDQVVTAVSHAGNCTRLILDSNADHEFTVFALDYRPSGHPNVTYVHVPAIRRPLFALFLTFHLMAPMVYLWHRWRTGARYDLIQTVESTPLFTDVVYIHFCHRAYIRTHRSSIKERGLRRWARFIDHILRASLEPFVFRRASGAVVPSEGLKRELEVTYPEELAGKIRVIANPIPIETLQPPADLDREHLRASHDIDSDDLALVFVALGHFDRKGLPILLEALQEVADPRVKLIVVGGLPAAVGQYRRRAAHMGVDQQVRFVGMHADVRPFLWMADLFAFPSSYETFSMVAFEAAASGLPLLITDLYGVQDVLEHGVNGWSVPRSANAFAERIVYALEHRADLAEIGARARETVASFRAEHFAPGGGPTMTSCKRPWHTIEPRACRADG